jgi:hypothetical protein
MARYTRASVYVYDAMRCDNHDGDSTASASTIMDATITAGNIRALERTTSEVGWGGAEYRGAAHIRYHNVSDTNCNRRSRVTLPKLAHSIYLHRRTCTHYGPSPSGGAARALASTGGGEPAAAEPAGPRALLAAAAAPLNGEPAGTRTGMSSNGSAPARA